ncbi:IS66-like element accessory protein TnpA [Piscinibacter sakaiensis]|uniref:IS66-like element accessory protein TnpA n=1 Tax=Piscinibacter sakaiensis TaxID=1547922 RepID=UPI003AAC99C6
MEEAKPASRRRHDPGLKQQVLAECDRPGASVAGIAMAHGLNANLVHKWRRHQATRDGHPALPAAREVFVPVSLSPADSAPPADIRIELRRGATAMNVTWPVSASIECATWMRELLR